MIGAKFHKLTVIAQGPPYIPPSKKARQRQWVCACECGGQAIVRTGHLMQGAVKSCGCGQHTARTTELSALKAERVTWNNMRARCHNPKHPKFHQYGGKGITVCERWRNDFAAFVADMGPRPFPRAEIDRKDNSKGYEPGNCRWASRREQCNNLSSNVLIEHDGVTKSRTAWAREFGISVETLKYRLSRGEALMDALTRPPRPTGR